MSLPLPAKLQRALKGNKFWETIKHEVPRLGFNGFRAEDTHTENLLLVIPAYNPVRKTLEEIKYSFPRHNARKFSTALNFKSQLRNFIITITQEKGLLPPNAPAEKIPPRPVQKFRLDQNKPPQSPPEPFIPPVIDGPLTVESVFRPKPPKPVEPPPVVAPEPVPPPPVVTVEEQPKPMVLAIFQMLESELSVVCELLNGIGTLQSSHRLTIIKEEPKPAVVKAEQPKPEPKKEDVYANIERVMASSTQVPPPDSPKPPPPRPIPSKPDVKEPPPRTVHRRQSRVAEQKKIIDIMKKRPKAYWEAAMIMSHFPKEDRDMMTKVLWSLGNSKTSPVLRAGHGVYKLSHAKIDGIGT